MFHWQKANCSETCGNITIPYPFSIGDPHCYLNPWFEITCSSSSSSTTYSRPFLSIFNLEVLDITLRSILVDNAVYSTCKDGSSWNSSDVHGSPFMFSNSNIFLTVGCENTLMKNRRKQVLAGCTSTCRGESPSSNACSKCNGRCDQDVFTHNFYCRRNRTTEIIIAGTVGGGGLIVILFIFCFGMYKLIKRRRELKMKKKFFKRNGGLLLQQQLSSNSDSFDTTKIFTKKELEKATDSFNISRVLGQGGQGTVYKGMLTDEKIVSVKKSRLVDEGQVEQFINEVVILSQINHRNIVKLLGCCLETEVPLLVYEFISNGTLSHLIRNQDDEFSLSWEMRLQIAAQVSGALAYLHSATSVPIYHRDIKSSNILLDDKYGAKVADFGTSRSVSIDQTHLTTIVQGTFGYLDPEFFQSSQFTDKSDVYSFRVVLAELLTGERPILSRAGQEEKNLAAFFISSLEEDFLFDIIDGSVAREGHRDEIIALAALARICLNLNGKHRPAMKQVMFEIEQIRTSHTPCTVSQEFRQFLTLKDAQEHSYQNRTGGRTGQGSGFRFSD
uniref:Protein kinase domain-containing protein n=1 Tax=Kalanchoe fedtschenkoi TaxID=63787 RepID=A0A7N0UET8_KALFE